MERGKTRLRDSKWFCSTHVTIDQATGQVQSHVELFDPEPNQNQASPALFWLHFYDGTRILSIERQVCISFLPEGAHANYD
jgi:hypothetical protein